MQTLKLLDVFLQFIRIAPYKDEKIFLAGGGLQKCGNMGHIGARRQGYLIIEESYLQPHLYDLKSDSWSALP